MLEIFRDYRLCLEATQLRETVNVLRKKNSCNAVSMFVDPLHFFCNYFDACFADGNGPATPNVPDWNRY